VQAEKDGKVIVDITSDVLIVATGANHEPRYIDLPGYTGEVSHSVDYRDASPFRGKNVMVIGVGESSSDMTHDIAAVAKSCSVWSRHHIVLGPRFLTMVDDPAYDEAKLLQTQSKRHDKVNIFLETITTNRLAGWLPLWYYALIRQIIWKKQDQVTPFTLLADWSRITTQDVYFRADQAGIVTKNGSLSVSYARGTIHSIVSKTVKFDDKKVIFPDTIWFDGIVPSSEKSIEEVDHILLCTGFQTDFSWLEVENLNWSPRSWYKHCFPPGELGNKLMFLGWTRPHQGGIPACSEILSRYIAMILSGERSLPKNHDQIAQYEGSLEMKYYSQHPNVPVVVDLPAFMESIATIIGCQPQPPSIWNLERFGQYWLYPSWPCWYRQRGPGAKPEILEQVLEAMPLTKYFDVDPPTILGIPMAVTNYLFSFVVRCLPLVSYWYL
jgi:dimethylaniline monooxygenase (N-oxide forming)